jgi:hypothetical protein
MGKNRPIWPDESMIFPDISAFASKRVGKSREVKFTNLGGKANGFPALP